MYFAFLTDGLVLSAFRFLWKLDNLRFRKSLMHSLFIKFKNLIVDSN